MIQPASRPPRKCLQNHNNSLTLESLESRYMLSATPSPLNIAGGLQLTGTEIGHAETAYTHLGQSKETTHLQQGESDLRVLDVATDQGVTTTFFQQIYAGLPVHGAIVSVVSDVEGIISDVFDHGWNNLVAETTVDAQLSGQEAIALASTNLGLQGLASSADLVWYPTGRDLSMAWQVNTGDAVLDAGFSSYLSIIDAQHGDVLSHEKIDSTYLEQFASDTGVFPRIVINNNIGAQGSRDFAAPFDAVASLSQGCTGTLIAPDLVIAARHCGSGSQVRFGDSENNPTHIALVQSTSYPAGGGSLLDGGDVSLIRLRQPVPSGVATPMRLIEEGAALEGEVALTLGYGYNGLGSSGHGFTADGFRWGGENIIDRYGSPAGTSGSNIFSTDFDNGTSSANTIGGSDPTPLVHEATTAPGDSGGPLLVQSNGEWLIAGVLSGGTTSNSVYGDISWWTGVAPFRDQIEAAGGEFIGGGLGTVALDKGVYNDADTIEVTVRDPNAVAPVQVTLTSELGDSELITLTNTSGSNYAATINTAAGAASTNDGALQVAFGNDIVATYQDPDNGMGSPNTATATAIVAQVSHYPSTDIPVSIFDLQTVTSDLQISDMGTIVDIDVQINITHTYDSDLNVFLNGPDGTRIELFSGVGGSGNNFNDTILDDEANNSIGSGGAPFAGTYSPTGSLSAFDGKALDGTWTLEIRDTFNQDQGSLNSWCIFAVVETTSTITGDFNGDGTYDCADINGLIDAIQAGTNNPAYDLTGDNVVDLADRDAWLAEAGAANLGPGQSYSLGDANLDGLVDGDDFAIWNDNKFKNGTWCTGDFNGDGHVNGRDFLLWNANRTPTSLVPVFSGEVAAKFGTTAFGNKGSLRPVRAPLATAPAVTAIAPSHNISSAARDTVFATYRSASDGDKDDREEEAAPLRFLG